jgi:pimeloyl-ACP methyl ester carboxylesterase
MNMRRKGKNARIAITFAFFCLSMIYTTIMLSIIGNHITNNFAHGQTDNTASIANNQFDVYKIPLQKVSVGDIEIAYKTFGNGTNTVLLISGGSNTMNFWDPYLLKELARKNTIIVFDSRGIGNSTSGEKPFSIKQFANDTVGLLDTIGVSNKVDILGFSLGSLVAQEIAYMHQDKVNRLILYGSLCGGKDAIPPSPVLQNFTDALQNPERANSTSDGEIYGILGNVLFPTKWINENPDYLERMPRQGVSIDPADATKLLGAFMSWVQTESCDKLNTIKMPTLVIVGTDDAVTSPENSLNLVKGVPGAWLIQVKGGGHGLMFQNPGVFTNALQAFLAISTTL